MSNPTPTSASAQNSNASANPATISMVIDLSVASSMVKSIPPPIAALLPTLPKELAKAESAGNRFFGCVVAPGPTTTFQSEVCSHLSFAEDFLGKLLGHSQQHGATSKWIIVTDKATKKGLVSMVDKLSLAMKATHE